MKEIGEITQLQIQQSRLKIEEGKLRRYDPSGIRKVPALRLTPDGVIGITAGEEIIDVHHLNHPASLNRRYKGAFNAISFNFTSHYQRMVKRFGQHGEPGFAGENILVETDKAIILSDIQTGLFIRTADGQNFPLVQVTVAAPCVPFSTFMLNWEGKLPHNLPLRQTLQFLHHGTRGFLCQWDGLPVTIRAGDKLCLSNNPPTY